MSNSLPLAACQRFSSESVPKGWDVVPIRKRMWLEYGSGLVEAERGGGDCPVYGSNGIVGHHSHPLVEGPGILVGRKGSVGVVHFCPGDFWPIDTVYYVRRLGNDSWKYLYYLLQHLRLDRLNAATGVPGLTRRDAHFMLGAFPSEEEQKKIVELADVCERAVNDLEKELAAARCLKTALIQQLFTKGIPGKHKRFQAVTLGRKEYRIPVTWRLTQIKDVLSEPLVNGVSPQSRPDPPGYPILNVSCISDGLCNPALVTYVDVDAVTFKAYLARKGDFFVLRGNGNIDYVASGGLLREEPNQTSMFSDLLIRLRFNTDVADRFIPWMWQSKTFLHRLQSKAKSGSGLWKIGLRDIRRESILLPPKDEQEMIVEALEISHQSLDALQSKVDALYHLKKSLLKNLLTGKVRVTPEPRRR